MWAAGELCGLDGVVFLVACASAGEPNIRRLAASALGKVAAAVRADAKQPPSALSAAQAALQGLLQDPAPQVRQYAQKSLGQFSA